jgi:hypothetical protein
MEIGSGRKLSSEKLSGSSGMIGRSGKLVGSGWKIGGRKLSGRKLSRKIGRSGAEIGGRNLSSGFQHLESHPHAW